MNTEQIEILLNRLASIDESLVYLNVGLGLLCGLIFFGSLIWLSLVWSAKQ